MKRQLLMLTAAVAFAHSAIAADLKPAVVFDMGGKFDKSFNQGVYEGVENFKKERNFLHLFSKAVSSSK